jgi:hypothetical protein
MQRRPNPGDVEGSWGPIWQTNAGNRPRRSSAKFKDQPVTHQSSGSLFAGRLPNPTLWRPPARRQPAPIRAHQVLKVAAI